MMYRYSTSTSARRGGCRYVVGDTGPMKKYRDDSSLAIRVGGIQIGTVVRFVV
ncbi:MAG: hypothetical protein L0Z07_02740 [Planctomycetes bacterium]|nr:hypothetical protein [Planctomycetota bacterium]